MAICRDRGLCYHCEEKWAPSHHFKPRLHLFIADEEIDFPSEISLSVSPEPVPLPKISLNAMEGTSAHQFKRFAQTQSIFALFHITLVTPHPASHMHPPSSPTPSPIFRFFAAIPPFFTILLTYLHPAISNITFTSFQTHLL